MFVKYNINIIISIVKRYFYNYSETLCYDGGGLGNLARYERIRRERPLCLSVCLSVCLSLSLSHSLTLSLLSLFEPCLGWLRWRIGGVSAGSAGAPVRHWPYMTVCRMHEAAVTSRCCSVFFLSVPPLSHRCQRGPGICAAHGEFSHVQRDTVPLCVVCGCKKGCKTAVGGTRVRGCSTSVCGYAV